jgi:tRNA-dihydrouridine synthase
MIERHVELLGSCFPEPRILAANFKKYVAAYSKGLPDSAAFRRQALEAQELDVVLGLTREYFGRLRRAA